MDSNSPSQGYALVTGSSKGLGKAFSRELSKRKINTILVDLPGENLNKQADNLSMEFGTNSVYYETDLTKKENLIQLAKWINENYRLKILINNAGAGGSKEFLDADMEYINRIIQLNVKAPSILTHQLLPNLIQEEQAFILNVSSLSAFSPNAYKTVYPASKVFINYFSLGLREELIDTNVFVSVVNPGPIQTNAEVTQRMYKQGFFARLGNIPASEVARISLDKLFRRQKIILLNKTNVFLRILMKITPIEIRLPLLTKITKRELQN